jgi:prevent-host-death family protein
VQGPNAAVVERNPSDRIDLRAVEMYIQYRGYVMTEVSTVDVREQLSELVNRVHYGKERVVVTRRGKRLIALVPVEDLELIEAIEDRIDVQAAKKALKEKGSIPWTRVKKQLGL